MSKGQFLSMIHALRHYFQDSSNGEKIELFIEKAKNENAWFSDYLIRNAMRAIESQFLDPVIWERFFDQYGDGTLQAKRIGLILSGNLPAVGMHDVLMTLAAGHQVVVKLSSQDQALMRLYIEAIQSTDLPVTIELVDRLPAVDAVIATGSDFSSSYFAAYFVKIPHIIRKNRSSVAVLKGSEGVAEFEALSLDIFTYYGLGCRNVSTLAVPVNFDLTPLFDVLTKVEWVLGHTKYANNYQYHKTLMLLNQIPHFDLGNLIVTESEQLVSPVGVLHIHRYATDVDLENWLGQHAEKVQCVVGTDFIPFGEAQMPALDDFADGINTYEFLVNRL